MIQVDVGNYFGLISTTAFILKRIFILKVAIYSFLQNKYQSKQWPALTSISVNRNTDSFPVI